MSFEKNFGQKPQATCRSHGRVNLIGEHTDYNEGFVFPSLIPQATVAEGSRRDDLKVVVVSKNLGNAEYTLGEEKRGPSWSDYILGATQILSRAGFKFKGFNLYVESSVPVGSGLSSSAAVLVAVMRLIRELYSLDLVDSNIPKLCQRVENEFVGAQVGIMDPTACAFSQIGHALFVDVRSMETRNIKIPSGAELLVINSGVSHQNAKGDYNTRRRECEEAARGMGVRMLRDLNVSDLPRAEKVLPQNPFKRARHIVTENARVLSCVQAFEEGNLPLVGKLFNGSHISQRDDFEVSVPEIDCLVDLCLEDKKVFGARLTGGGFGGSIVALTEVGAARTVGEVVVQKYSKKMGRNATILVP